MKSELAAHAITIQLSDININDSRHIYVAVIGDE